MTSRGLRKLCAALAVSALAAATLPALAAAECEPIMPTSAVTAGMTGTGWTVGSGRTRESFDVEVLGVLKNGVAPGRDIIIVEASSPRIDKTGIWAGMSGSPVYIGGQFVGALAYGFAWGPAAIAGLTPAEDVAAVATLPLTAQIQGLTQAPRSVRLSAGLTRTVAARTGASTQAAASLTQLRLPLSVSGLGAREFQRLTKKIERDGAPFLPYAGSSASGGGAPGDAPEAGDNFAATVSVGDVTLAAVGTTSYVCDGRAVAFGHPATFGGDVTLGANAADALAIVPDLFVSYKLANVAESLGALDQDRLAGVRGLLGEEPAAMPIRARVNVPALGRSRDSATDVYAQDWASELTYYHLVTSVISEFDSIGPGTAAAWWTFEGKRADGSTWRLNRGNRFVSDWSIANQSAFSMAIQLDQLLFNPWEKIEVTDVRASLTVERPVRRYRVVGMTISKNRGPFRAVRQVRARPGTGLRARVTLRPQSGGPDRVVTLPFRIPTNAFPYGRLVVGGPVSFYDDEDFYFETDGARSFDELLANLQNAQRNDVLAGRLLLGPGRARQRGLRQVRLTSVVSGTRSVRILPENRAMVFVGRPR